jgi:hypothetical protein
VLENMHLEYQRLLAAHPDLPARLQALPGRVFSGKAHIQPNTQAVFFCFAHSQAKTTPSPTPRWTPTRGRWLLAAPNGCCSTCKPAKCWKMPLPLTP